MFFYYSISIICFIICVFDFPISQNPFSLYQKQINQKTVLFLIGSCFVILGGIRWLTGTDWPPYYHFFNDNVTWENFKKYRFEIGYTFLNWGVKCFFNEYTAFLIIFSFLVITPKVFIINKISPYPLLSLFLYSCTYTGEIFAVRNQLGVTLLICSIPAMQEKNFKKFLLCTVIASTIHYSCMAWIISYYIYNKTFNKKTWFKLYFFACIFMLIGKGLYPRLISKIFKPLAGYGIIIEKLLSYSSSEYKDIAVNAKSLILSLVKRMLFLPFYFVYFKDLIKKNKFNKGLLNLYLYGNAFQLFFYSGFQQMGRLILANIFLEIFLLPQLILLPKNKSIKMLMLFMLFFYGMLKITHILPFKDVLVPYYSIFNYEVRYMY